MLPRLVALDRLARLLSQLLQLGLQVLDLVLLRGLLGFSLTLPPQLGEGRVKLPDLLLGLGEEAAVV